MRNLFSFLLTLTFLFMVPDNAEAQDSLNTTPGFNWERIDFNDPGINYEWKLERKTSSFLVLSKRVDLQTKRAIFFRPEFVRGRFSVTSAMSRAFVASKPHLKKLFASSHEIIIFGTNNFKKNNQSRGLPDQEKSPPARHISADADLSRGRSLMGKANEVVSKIVYDRKHDPDKLESRIIAAPDNLQVNFNEMDDYQSLLARKSAFVIGVKHHVSEQMNSLQNRITTLQENVQSEFASIRKRLAAIEERNNLQQKQIDTTRAIAEKALEKAESGTELSVFVGAGGQFFAGEAAGVGELGIRVENTVIGAIELSGFRGVHPNIGTMTLPQLGQTQLGRSTKGASLAFYPVQDKRLEIGAAFGYTHAEDFLRGREEFLAVYESLDAGLALNIKVWRGLYLHGVTKYAVTSSAEVADLDLERLSDQKISAQFGLRWRF